MNPSTKNVIAAPKKVSLGARFAGQFKDFMIITLIAASVISLYISYLEGQVDLIEPGIILGIVLINATLGVFQENKAERSLDALKKLSSPHATVLVGGKRREIASEDVQVGDRLVLTAGNYVCADARVVAATALTTEESALTGETNEIAKNTSTANRVFSGTLVASGHGEAIVEAIGMDTELGKIAEMLKSQEAPATPLQKRLAATGKTLGIGAFIICGILFILGLIKGNPPLFMLMTTVSLAVAAIPEGLPAIVTIMLSIGVERMAKKNAVIRKLPAVETLGSATVICSDKTGTLTENRMQVVEQYTLDSKKELALCGVLCNNESAGVEAALLRFGETQGYTYSSVSKRVSRLHEIPFDAKRKRMTTLHLQNGGYRSITKGAPEYVLELCTHYIADGVRKELTPNVRRGFQAANHSFATKALRVLAFAEKHYSSQPSKSARGLESGLTLRGLVGFMDPPRQEVPAAVKQCKRAGIRPVMITGDHALTAASIGQTIGLSDNHHSVLTGKELAAMTDAKLHSQLYDYSIFARVTPADKVRLVKAFQAKGEIVAMTGDGVNDAPALKMADIGCAMGVGGTDVAKNAADMVLMDDNFATIVTAVEEGRGIYDNIKKAIHFLLSCNIGEIVTIFICILFGFPSPLMPVQLLFINLITDSFPAISLGMEAPEKDIMSRSPRGKDKGLFSVGNGASMVFEGMFIGLLALFSYIIGFRYGTYQSATGTTMCFGVLALSQLTHSLNMRSHRSIFRKDQPPNRKLTASIVLCVGMLLAVMVIPSFQVIFQLVPLTWLQWAMVFALSLVPIPLMELQKAASS